MQLDFVHEPEILGTGGGVRNAWDPHASEDFLVWNAKLLFAPNLARALAAHRAHDAIATLVLRAQPTGSTFAPVEVDTEGRVLRIRGEPRSNTRLGHARMFASVQILSARAHRDLPSQGDIFEHAYIPWLTRGEYVSSITDDSPWFDVGVTPAHYLEANMALATGTVRWPGIEPLASAVIADHSARVAPGAQIEASVLGRAAVVADGARLERVVAWDGAQVQSSLRNAIVTSAGRVVRIG
jgi:NDP-sugar pyrophosphorylase family protein